MSDPAAPIRRTWSEPPVVYVDEDAAITFEPAHAYDVGGPATLQFRDAGRELVLAVHLSPTALEWLRAVVAPDPADRPVPLIPADTWARAYFNRPSVASTPADLVEPRYTVTETALAAAFTEWDRRYREEPERFLSEAVRLIREDADTYGKACAPYLLEILSERPHQPLDARIPGWAAAAAARLHAQGVSL